MKISSSAFSHGGRIPPKYTCDGDDFSPLLSIDSVAKGTKSLSLIVDDPDAPGGVFVHWVIWNVPPTATSIPERVPAKAAVDSIGGAKQGVTDFGRLGYGGPCPPPGPAHRYFFKLYALDGTLNLRAGASKAELEAAMKGHILAEATLMGTYQRQGR